MPRSLGRYTKDINKQISLHLALIWKWSANVKAPPKSAQEKLKHGSRVPKNTGFSPFEIFGIKAGCL